MAKYAISEEGVSQLQKLSKGIISDTENIYEAGILLKNNISSLGEGLGVYEDEIIDLVNHNQATLQSNREVFKQLSDSINKVADEICSLMGFDDVSFSTVSESNAYRANRNNSGLHSSNGGFGLDKLSSELTALYSSKYGKYISPDKLDKQFADVKYISKKEMIRKKGDERILGYYEGGTRLIIQEGTDYVTQTLVHENLHMLSNNSNGDGVIKKRKYGGGYDNIGINEAITEMLTKRSLGEQYGPDYSAYSENRDAMTILENSLGEDLIAEAYFQNKPELMEQKIEDVLGYGSWGQLSEAFDDCLSDNYHTKESGKIRRDNLIDRFMRSTNFIKGGDDEWLEILM